MKRITPHQHGLDVDAIGCRNLWLAKMEAHFMDATRIAKNAKEKRDRERARAWFASQICAEVCTLIGLDPAWIREGAARAFVRIDAEGGRKGALLRWDKATVQAIFDLHKHVGLTQQEIGERYGVSRESISGVLRDFRAAQLMAEARAA